MNRQDILQMGRQAGSFIELAQEKDLLWLERFAALVASAEREAIAQSLDKQADLACDEIDRQWAQEMAAAVRARSNA